MIAVSRLTLSPGRRSGRRRGLTATAGALGLLASAAVAQAQPGVNLLQNPGFEQFTPSYWARSQSGSATATWASDEHHSGGYSLKLAGAAGGTATWLNQNFVRNWTPSVPGAGNPLMIFGAWAKTSGLAAGAATIEYDFFRGGARIFPTPVTIAVPAGTKDWTELRFDTPVEFPAGQPADSATIRVRTTGAGTVWVDDFFMRGQGDGWPGDIHNAEVDVPKGYFYYQDGMSSGFPNNAGRPYTMLSVADSSGQAHSGSAYGYIYEDGSTSPDDEPLISTDGFPVQPGKSYMLNTYIKSRDFNLDSAYVNDNYKLYYTVITHRNIPGPSRGGWGEFRGEDVEIPLRDRTGGYAQYSAVINTPAASGDAVARALTVRLRTRRQLTGGLYFDDFYAVEMPTSAQGNATVGVRDWTGGSTGAQPERFALIGASPNPFNPTTTVEFRVADRMPVTLAVYDVLGRQVGLLAQSVYSAGFHRVTFDGSGLTSGLYLVRMTTPSGSRTIRTTLMK